MINEETDVVEKEEVDIIEESPEYPVESPEHPVEPPEPPKPPEEDIRVRNLRMIGKAKEKLEERNRVLLAEKAVLQTRLNERKPKEDEDDGDYVDSNAELKKQIVAMQNQQQHFLNQMAIREASQRLVSKHSDFEDVVSKDNVSVLEGLDPLIIDEIASEQDIYKKGIKAYNAIRKHKIYQAANDLADNKEAILKNLAKPKPSNTVSNSASNNKSVFADLNSRDYQNKLKRQLEEAKGRM